MGSDVDHVDAALDAEKLHQRGFESQILFSENVIGSVVL